LIFICINEKLTENASRPLIWRGAFFIIELILYRDGRLFPYYCRRSQQCDKNTDFHKEVGRKVRK